MISAVSSGPVSDSSPSAAARVTSPAVPRRVLSVMVTASAAVPVSVVAADTVALRHADPTGLVVVIRYTAPKPLSHAEWLKRTRPGGPLGDVFGEKILARVSSRLADHEALKVVAEGTEVDKTYRFESWLVPVGNTAFRLTIGSPVTEFARAEPTFRRIVASFRLIPLRKMSSLSVSLLRVSPGARPPSLRSSPAPC